MTEYKAGTAIELKGDHNIEWVELTEQQILDKTIEYLDHNSLCFSKWRYCRGYDNECNHIIAITWDEDKYAETTDDLSGNNDSSIGNYDTKYNCDYKRIMHSEFNIAYNIIKDLAQHGTNN